MKWNQEFPEAADTQWGGFPRLMPGSCLSQWQYYEIISAGAKWTATSTIYTVRLLGLQKCGMSGQEAEQALLGTLAADKNEILFFEMWHQL